MAILKNELSWSFSRDRIFKNCKRSYYYNYYASWGWWKNSSSEFSRKSNILKKMKNLPMWRGEVVHEVLKWILEEKSRGRNISHEIAKMKARSLLREGWKDSKNKEWNKDTKKLNLFEHYYEKSISKEQINKIKKNVYSCIENFYNSGFLKRLGEIKNKTFLHIEDIENFNYKGLKVYVSPDFALKTEKYCLFDWKTGKPSENDKLQISCYGLFGVNKWNVAIENIKITPVYLINENVKFSSIKTIDVDKVKDYIDNSVNDMKQLLADIKTNYAEIDDFPKVDNPNKCSRCFFQELCMRS